jgi:long-subunit acyl-CoA synthetase (AMP-forming)
MAAAPPVHIAPLRSAHVTYVMRRFELKPYLEGVEKFKITELFVVPPLVISIVMSPMSKVYSLNSVKQASCGAAPLGKDPQGRFRALLSPDARITQVYGMTETTCIATMFRWDEDDRTASVGRFIPNMEAR